MLRLHTVAPMKLTTVALPLLVRRKGGAVINVSSIASFIYSAGNVNYCATKAYLTTFTEGLAAELRGYRCAGAGALSGVHHHRVPPTEGGAPVQPAGLHVGER